MSAEENREITRRFVEEVWGRGDLDVAREIIDEHVVHHRQRAEEPLGIEGLFQGVRMYEQAYPERRFTQEDVIVDGKLVQDRWIMTAVHAGELLGVAPTGRQVRLEGQNRYLIEDGKIVEVWHDEDIYGMMRQIGWTPSLPEVWPPRAETRYRLGGPQVEPDAAFWTDAPCATPGVVRLTDLRQRTDDPQDPWYFPPYPDADETRAEIEELRELASLRNDPAALSGGSGSLWRQAVSPFLQLRPPPFDAVYNSKRPASEPLITTGAELARWFESERPGLSHRHAATELLRETGWSPPREARVWMALHVAMYSAALAAWHYKWATERPRVAFRPRPVEVDYRVSVLYNRAVADVGEPLGPRRVSPQPSPGSPRHPSYPSGHSTIGAAGSEILSYFFPDHTAELDQLADNCGMGRLWAGIHYRSDHVVGTALGRHVARMVIEQLQADGAGAGPGPTFDGPPTFEDLRQRAQDVSRRCAERVPR